LKRCLACLFDLDGTLVVSEPLKAEALARACSDFGAHVDVFIYKEVMGENWRVVTRRFFKAAGIAPDENAFDLRFRLHYETLLQGDLILTPGVDVFLDHLRKSGTKCCVVSSGARWMVEQILKQTRLSGAFDLVITEEDVSQHKPDPEAYELALSMLGVTGGEAVVFEDSEPGLRAGADSGCDLIAVRHEFNENNELSLAKEVISDFSTLLDFPPFRNLDVD
jgi:HAD superfamily hydrolase (TIGR01509 family)